MNRRIPEPDRRPGTTEVPAGGTDAAPPPEQPPNTRPRPRAGRRPRTPEVERRQLLAKHTALVGRMAKAMLRRMPTSVEYHDLVSAGTVGLLEAIDRFDPGHGAAFDVFASARIRGAMLDELRTGVPVARAFWADRRRVDDATAGLTLRYHREPTSPEIAAETGLSVGTVDRVRTRSGPVAVTLDDVPADAPALLDRSWAGDPEAAAARAEIRDRLRWALDLLPDRSREILRRYYIDGLTFARIARTLGVTESRVAQLHAQALHRLHDLLNDVGADTGS